MADNVAITAGSGTTVATDDVGGVHFQKVKLDLGTDGASTPVTGSVPINDNSGSLTVDGTVAISGTVAVTDNSSTLSVDDGAGSLTIDNAALSVTGGGVEASALRVTLASDSTGVVSVDDNGASLTVDGTVAATQSGTWNVGTVTTVSAVTAISNALPAGTNNIGDVDVLSVVPGTGAASLGKAEDAAHTTGDTGVMALAVRRDADTTLADTTGDYAPLQVNASGSLKVAITSGAGSGGTSLADDDPFTAASTSFTPVGGIVTSDSVDSGDGGAFAMLANRQQKVTLYDSAGVELAVGGGTQYDEDTAHSSGDKITMAGVVRRDANTTLADTDGDRTALQVNSVGALKVALVSSSVAVSNEPNVNILDVIPGTGATSLGKAEDAAHTTGDVGVMALAVRQNTQSDFGADGDYVPLSVADDGGVRVSSTNTAAGAPIAVRISDGSAFPTPGVDYTHDGALTMASTAGPATVVRASAANPSDVSADDDAAIAWADRKGAQVVAGRIVDDAAFTPGTDRVHPVGFFADESSTDSVDEGDLGAARMTLDRKQIFAHYAHAAGGATPGKVVSAASTNATSVKGSAGTLYMVTASNVNAAARYLKFYNKATAPTVGTDTPVLTFIIPGNTAGAGTNIPIPSCGINFSTGIALALTTEATDAGSTGVAANELVVNYAYA